MILKIYTPAKSDVPNFTASKARFKLQFQRELILARDSEWKTNFSG